MANCLFFSMLLLPLLSPLVPLFFPFKENRPLNRYIFASTLLTSALDLLWIFAGTGEEIVLLVLDRKLSLAFRADGLASVFALIVAVLWPVAVLFAFEYMGHYRQNNTFFGFYTLTYAAVLGLAFAANYFTLYLFYELLTLCTLPLVIHGMDRAAKYAGKKYIIFSMSGAALGFISMLLIAQGGSLDYRFGGSIVSGSREYWQFVFILAFMGFGVKAAVFPLHSWLPSAGVAPTPVTALLHAVAVVNSGVFAIMRLIYYSIGTELLAGSWAQFTAVLLCCFTIVFGSLMSWRNRNLKRRLAYSTVSNLSYILLGTLAMDTTGLAAALLHMVVHSISKITLFFVAGTLLYVSHHRLKNVEDYEGFGRQMPGLFLCFTLAALTLMGIPPLPGFHSKWALATAALSIPGSLGLLGPAALAISAFLTAMYLLDVVIMAFAPVKTCRINSMEETPGLRIRLSLLLLTSLLIILTFTANGLYGLLSALVTMDLGGV